MGIFVAVAGSRWAHSGLLQETLFSRVVANHHLLSFAWEQQSDALYPIRLLEIARPQFSARYFIEDIVRVRKNGVQTHFLKQNSIEAGQSLPFRLFSFHGVIGLTRGTSGLMGEAPLAALARLQSDRDLYAGSLAARLGPCALALSYRRRPSSLFGDIQAPRYHRSEDPLENSYFWDPLENYFGKDMRLTGGGREKTWVIENKIRLGTGGRAGFRASKIEALDDFSLAYVREAAPRFIDAPFAVSRQGFDLDFERKIQDFWTLRFLYTREEMKARLDLLPRGVDPETEVVDLGGVSLESRETGYGIAAQFAISEAARIFGGFVHSSAKSHVGAILSTPVLGNYLGFLPIVHRARAQADLRVPAGQWQLGAAKQWGRRIQTHLVLNRQVLDIPVSVAGETQLAAGLSNSAFDRSALLKRVQLLYGASNAEWKLFDRIRLGYRIDLTVPILPKNFKEIAAFQLPKAGVEAPAPAQEPVERTIRGGLAHQFSLRYTF